MNRRRSDSIAHQVRSSIERGGEDRIWTYAEFPNVARLALAATFSRLTRAGVLTRVRRGVYYRPSKTIFGASTPDPVKLTDAVLQTHGLAGGVEAYNRLGLTTQTANVVMRVSAKRAAKGSIQGIRFIVRRRPLDKQRGIKSVERVVLDALRDVARIPDATPADVIDRVSSLVAGRGVDFERLARFAVFEPPRVRALLGAIGETLRQKTPNVVLKRDLDQLHDGLNPLTQFRIRGVAAALGDTVAPRWRLL